jgi:arylsulfatase A-like enzyme
MDYALGKVMKALDAVGVSENTLLIFTSDNGPVASEGGSTGGLRGGKRSDFEGGICVPFLVRWPSHVPAGTVSDVPVIGTDIFSTVLDITGIPQPTDRTIDGVSIFPVFNGQRVERKTPLFWRTHVSGADNRVAVRVDDWKIVANDTLTDFMLFNVQEDRVEKDDLTSKMPGKTEEMKKLLLATWADIVEEGPNEWWETERQKPSKGGTLSF